MKIKLNRKAFTFFEVIYVMIIISVVTSITLPAINNFHSSDRCKADASLFVNSVRLAKYSAMQDNDLNRIIFNIEDNICNGFKVQRYEGEEDMDSVMDAVQSYDAGDNVWSTISDEEEVEFNPSTEVNLSNSGLPTNTIFFKPDGYIYAKYSDGVKYLLEHEIVFKYGNAAIAVDINAIGVISSEAIAQNEDENEDYFDDKYNADNDTKTNYNTSTDTE